MAEGYLLSKKSAQRLGDAVRHVERQRVARTIPRRQIIATHEPLVVQITSNIAVGVYHGKSFRPPVVQGVGALTASSLGTLASANDVIVYDGSQADQATALPLTGLITVGEAVGADPDSGHTIVLIPPPGVRKLRFNTSTKQLQAAYIPSPSGDSDWVDMVEFFACAPTP